MVNHSFKKLGKTITIILVTIIIAFITSGCWNREYSGDYPELYSVALSSLLGATGLCRHMLPQPTIFVIDEDDYGRVLFFYSDRDNISNFSFLISQKSDEEYVYFYPHYNFINFECLYESIGRGGMNRVRYGVIPPEVFEELKVRNDWNQELDLEKSIRTRIVRQKEEGPVRDRTLLELYNIAFGDDAWRNPLRFYITFLIADEYGRSVYLGTGGELRNRRYIAMLFQPDGSFDEKRSVMELYDTHNYQTALREFKELNGWNQPFEGSTSIAVWLITGLVVIVGLVIIVGVVAFFLVKMDLRKRIGFVKPLTFRKLKERKRPRKSRLKGYVKVAIYTNVPTLLVVTIFNLTYGGSWVELFLETFWILFFIFPITILLAGLMEFYYGVLYIIPVTIILSYLIYSFNVGLKPQKSYKVLYFVLSTICMVLFTAAWLAVIPIAALVSYTLSDTAVSIYKRLRRS